MCSSAPSSVSSAVPLTVTHRYRSSPSKTNTDTRGSRCSSSYFLRVTVMLKTTCSPSQSTHVAVWCGEPSARRVATTA